MASFINLKVDLKCTDISDNQRMNDNEFYLLKFLSHPSSINSLVNLLENYGIKFDAPVDILYNINYE